MYLSSGITRRMTMHEPGKDQEVHESKSLGVSADTWDCVYLNATTLLEAIAMTAEAYQDPKHVKTEVETSQQWKSNLSLDKIVDGTRSWIFGRSRMVGPENWVCQHNIFELAKNSDALGGLRVHAEWLQDQRR